MTGNGDLENTVKNNMREQLQGLMDAACFVGHPDKTYTIVMAEDWMREIDENTVEICYWCVENVTPDA